MTAAPALATGKCLVIGVGNPHRSDDQAGLHVAERLRELAAKRSKESPDPEIFESTGDGAFLIDCFSKSAHVIVIDAAHGGMKPGTIHRICASETHVPISLLSGSTHAFGVAEAIEVARALGRLPGRLIVYGIEAKSFDIGGDMCPEVGLATEAVADLIVEDLAYFRLLLSSNSTSLRLTDSLESSTKR